MRESETRGAADRSFRLVLDACAMELLKEAERIAPDFVLVYQYRSNVAYLDGDVDAAIRALEEALALQPDNVLFETNLRRLRKGPTRARR